MAKSFQDFVLQVKEQADIVKIISRYVALRRSGARFVGVCPFHNDHSPSMYVTPQMGIYKCFVCGAGGDVFRFLQEYEKLSFMDTLKLVSEELGLKVPTDLGNQSGGKKANVSESLLNANLIALEFFESKLEKSRKIRGYLQKRGIEPETSKSFHLGLAPNEWDGLIKYSSSKISPEVLFQAGLVKRNRSGQYYDAFVNRLIFPIWNLSHRLIAFGGRVLDSEAKPKYLNSPESLLYQKSRVLYGFNFSRQAVSQKNSLILVEGYMDVLALWQQGFQNVVSVSGTALTEHHSQMIARFTKKVFLFLDGDEAGQKAIKRSIPFLLKSGIEVKIPTIPNGEDPDSFAIKNGAQGLEKIFINSQNIVDFLTAEFRGGKVNFSPEAKHFLYQDCKTILANIPSEMVRLDYLEILNNIMGVPNKGITRSIPIVHPVVADVHTKSNRAGTKANMKGYEWRLFNLLLSNPDLVPLAIQKIDINWVQDPFLKPILDRLLAFCELEGKFVLSTFYQQLPAEQKNFLEAMELETHGNAAVQQQQFYEYLAEMEVRALKKSLMQVTANIKDGQIDRLSGLRKQNEIKNRLLTINSGKLSAQEEGKGFG